MKAKLTNALIKTLAPGVKPYEVNDAEQKGFLLRVQPSGTMTYYQSYRTEAGKRARIRIGKHGTLTLTQARDLARKKAGAVAQGVDVQAEKKEAKKKAEQVRQQTWGCFLDSHYSPWAESELKTAAKTLSTLESKFGQWRDKPMTDITPWLVTRWRSEQLKRKIGKQKRQRTPTGINREVASLRAALQKAVDWGVIDSHPLAKLKQLKTDRRPNVRYLSSAEHKRLLTALETRQDEQREERRRFNQWLTERKRPTLPTLDGARYTDHLMPMVQLALNTGMRRGELFNLRWADVSLKRDAGHRPHLTVRGDGAKSGQTRHIPLNDEAFAALVAWRNLIDSEELVFPSPVTGNRIDNIKKSWEGVIAAANIKDFRFHDLRHTFASWLVMKGVPLNTVRELMGHGSLEMTLRYAHLAPDNMAEAVALLNT